MKLTLQIQLLPDNQQADQLKSTIARFNQASSWLAEQAFELKIANKISLQQHFITNCATGSVCQLRWRLFAFVTSEGLTAGIKAFCPSFATTPRCPTTAASCHLRALTGFRF